MLSGSGDMQIRPTAFTIGLIIYSFIALFLVYTEFGIDSFKDLISHCFILSNIQEINDEQLKSYYQSRSISKSDINASDIESLGSGVLSVVGLLVANGALAGVGTIAGIHSIYLNFSYKMDAKDYERTVVEFIDSIDELIKDNDFSMTITRYLENYENGRYILSAEELPVTYPYVYKVLGNTPLIISTDFTFAAYATID